MDMEHTVSAFALIIAATSISLVLLFTEVLCIIVTKVDAAKHRKSAFYPDIETSPTSHFHWKVILAVFPTRWFSS